MENKSHALIAGAFVLAMLAMVVALVVWFTRDDTVRNTYELSTDKPVSGLQPQAAVRYRGIAVGKVTAVDFDPKARGNVRVRFSVDQRVPMTQSTFATLSYQGVTGLTFVALDDSGESQVALAPNADNPPRIPLRASMLAGLQERGESILGKVEAIGENANQLMGDDNQRRVAEALENLSKAAASANQLSAQLENTVRTGLAPALKALPPLVERTRDTLGSVKTAATDVSRVARNFNSTVTRLNADGGPIDRLGDGTLALSQALESFNSTTLPRVNRVVDDTSRAVRRLGRAADNINDNPQSLLYGTGDARAGPGEAGFRAPSARDAGERP